MTRDQGQDWRVLAAECRYSMVHVHVAQGTWDDDSFAYLVGTCSAVYEYSAGNAIRVPQALRINRVLDFKSRLSRVHPRQSLPGSPLKLGFSLWAMTGK